MKSRLRRILIGGVDFFETSGMSSGDIHYRMKKPRYRITLLEALRYSGFVVDQYLSGL